MKSKLAIFLLLVASAASAGKLHKLHWTDTSFTIHEDLWHNGVKQDTQHILHDYIKNNINAFKYENPDLIWQ